LQNMEIQRVKPLTDQVYDHLRSQILAGEMSAGARIVESQIAQQLNVSRSPVREAIQMLKKEGLLVQDTGKITVFQPSIADFKELYELRIAVEPVAVELATKRIQIHQLEQMADLLQNAEKSLKDGEIDDLIELNSQFHDCIIRFSGNRRFQKIMNEVSTLVRYYRTFVFKVYKRNIQSIGEHWAIYNAMFDKDALLARQLMKSHIENDLDFIIDQEM
jgi:DNA-binding GntR family transcriptional regulator